MLSNFEGGLAEESGLFGICWGAVNGAAGGLDPKKRARTSKDLEQLKLLRTHRPYRATPVCWNTVCAASCQHHFRRAKYGLPRDQMETFLSCPRLPWCGPSAKPRERRQALVSAVEERPRPWTRLRGVSLGATSEKVRSSEFRAWWRVSIMHWVELHG